jgi:GT2 family glycosyltransferase
MEAESDEAHPVVVGVPGVESTTRRRLAELLRPDGTIGVVVPRTVSSTGQLLEAGALLHDQKMVRRASPQSKGTMDYLTAAEVDGTTGQVLAIDSMTLRRLGLDPLASDLRRLSSAIVESVRSMGLRVVYEPTWVVVDDEIGRTEDLDSVRTEEGPASPSTNILVVAGLLPSSFFSDEDRSVELLTRALIGQTNGTDSALTIMATDAFRGDEAADRYRAAGIEVVLAPRDWGSWFADRHAQFSHVIFTQTGLRSPARSWIDQTQPQATKILFCDTLMFRQVESLRPATPADEIEGLESVRDRAEASLASLVGWVDAVWSERPEDTSFLTGLFPGKAISLLPFPVACRSESPAFTDRRGVVIVAGDGHDVLAANEDAALVTLRELIPAVRRFKPDLEVTVVSDEPTPMLRAAIREAGAEVTGSANATSVVSAAKVVVIAHRHGVGGHANIVAALEGLTPFVASVAAASSTDLGALRPFSVFGSNVDLVHHTQQLLTSEAEWTAFVDQEREFIRISCESAHVSGRLRHALAAAGISPVGSPLLPPPKEQSFSAAPPRVEVSLRPGWNEEAVDPGADPTGDEVARYALWSQRLGSNGRVLNDLRVDLKTKNFAPTISVIMPVYNTDPGILREAIDSVHQQIYPNWELCIADDGSTRADTLAVLAEAAEDPAIQVTRLGGQSGIAAASNAALAMATGEFVTFLDHDDLLKPHALAQVVRWLNADPDLDLIYSDEDKLALDGTLVQPHLKPDWSPDLLMSNNYVCHLMVLRRGLVERLGGFRSAFDGSQDYDLVLRVSEQTDRIAHIPEPLYTWRIIPGSAAEVADAKPYALEAAKRALGAALARRGRDGTIEETERPGIHRTRYRTPGEPKVSIIIPTRDGLPLLDRCLTSVFERTTYRNYEIVVIDNESKDAGTLGYLAALPGRVIHYPHRFNYARMMNLAARSVETDLLLFLNNDTEVITPEWVEALVEHAVRPEVGAVGGRLYFGDGAPQHEGILVGVGGWAYNTNHRGYWARGDMIRNTSAVTGACTMMRPGIYWKVGGNDERLRIAYNDVDLCLRVRQAGLQVVYTPYAELFHYESSTRSGYEHAEDGPLFGERWRPRERVDPYYSPLFLRDRPFLLRS